MSKKTTRNHEYSENQQVLFLAFDLGQSKWELGFTIGLGQKARRRAIEGGDTETLEKEIAAAKKRFRLPEGALVKSCYEAGRDGFWLHRYLTSAGIGNIVVDSASIEVDRRKRRAKTDSLDVGTLLSMLVRFHLGERRIWSVVRVPSVEEEDRRQLHRELRTLKKERTRTTNRIKGLLATQGIRVEGRMDLSAKQLDRMRLWSGAPLPAALKGRLEREWQHVLFLNKQIAALVTLRKSLLEEAKDSGVEKIQQLNKLKGIGIESSWVIVQELFGWRQFRNRREVGSLIGLTPSPYNSGKTVWEQGISKAGIVHVRAVSVELGWSWIRHQPKSKLTQWFLQRFAEGGPRARKVGIVALARRLMIELWRFLQYGVLPEGALLKGEA